MAIVTPFVFSVSITDCTLLTPKAMWSKLSPSLITLSFQQVSSTAFPDSSFMKAISALFCFTSRLLANLSPI